MGLQRVGHDLMTKQQKQLASVFLPVIPSLPEISPSLLSLTWLFCIHLLRVSQDVALLKRPFLTPPA